MRVKTVAQVIAGEAGGKSLRQRFSAMKDVASAIYNRAQSLGVSMEDVVGVQSEFNAYNTTSKAVNSKTTQLALKALSDVMKNGPTHKGSFYARSYATKNLPKGLKKVHTAVDDHQYFSDPQNRAIKTKVGFKTPDERKLAEPSSWLSRLTPTQKNVAPTLKDFAERWSAPMAAAVAASATPAMAQPSPERFATPEERYGPVMTPDTATAIQSAYAPPAQPSAERFGGVLSPAQPSPDRFATAQERFGPVMTPDTATAIQRGILSPARMADNMTTQKTDRVGLNLSPSEMAELSTAQSSFDQTRSVNPIDKGVPRSGVETMAGDTPSVGSQQIKAAMDRTAKANIGYATDPTGQVADPFGNYAPGGALATAKDNQQRLTAGDDPIGPAQEVAATPNARVASAAVAPSAAPVQQGPHMAPQGPVAQPDAPADTNTGQLATANALGATGFGGIAAGIGNAFGKLPGMMDAQVASAPAFDEPTEVDPTYDAGYAATPTEKPAGAFPDAPTLKDAPQPSRLSGVLSGALTGALTGGLPGAAIGALGGILSGRLGPGFDAGMPQSERRSVGQGLGGIMAALGGVRGDTARSLSNPGMSVTNLGNGQSLRRSDTYGWTEVVGPDGSVKGIQYDRPDQGGILGMLSRSMNSRFGGKGAGISPAASAAISKGGGGLY